MNDAKLILKFIKELEESSIEVHSRYGNHKETKKYLEDKIDE